MKHYRLEPQGAAAIEFDAELIGESSTQDEAESRGRRRWSEQRIYRTKGGKLIAERVGCSDLPGERDLVTVVVAATPAELVEKLRELNPRHLPADMLLPDYCLLALDQAARHVEGLAPLLTVRID